MLSSLFLLQDIKESTGVGLDAALHVFWCSVRRSVVFTMHTEKSHTWWYIIKWLPTLFYTYGTVRILAVPPILAALVA